MAYWLKQSFNEDSGSEMFPKNTSGSMQKSRIVEILIKK